MSAGALTAKKWPILTAIEKIELREGLYDLLTRHGFPVITAHARGGALDMLKPERPSMLLADATASDTVGWELTSGIRSVGGTSCRNSRNRSRLIFSPKYRSAYRSNCHALHLTRTPST